MLPCCCSCTNLHTPEDILPDLLSFPLLYQEQTIGSLQLAPRSQAIVMARHAGLQD
jgi:hypothetical protein